MIMCFTVPEIWHKMNAIVIFHFGLFLSFYLQTAQKMKVSHKWKKILGDVIILQKCTKNHSSIHKFYFSFWAFFFLFLTLSQKRKISKKIKKMSGGIIIFYKCTKNHNYMLGLFFCVFTTLTAQKMNFSKKWKKCQRYHFMQVYQKTWSYDILFPGYVMGQM